MAEVVSVALDVVLPILLVVLVGLWFGRAFKPDPRFFSRLMLYVLSPSLTFDAIVHSEITVESLVRLAGASLLVMLALAALGFVLARMHKLQPETMSAFVLVVTLSNSGNFGLPFIEFAFGRDGLVIAVILVVYMAIFVNTLGIAIASSGQASIKQGIINVLSVPLPYAALSAFVISLGGIALPVPLERGIGILAQGMVPVMLLLLGVQLSRIRLDANMRRLMRPLVTATGGRLLLSAVVAATVAQLFGLTGLVYAVFVLEFAMPAAVNTIVLSTEFEGDVRFATAAIFITTFVSVATLSALLTLLRMLLIN